MKITAQEARQIRDSKLMVSFDIIMEIINEAANMGLSHIDIHFDINKDQITLLKDLGYDLPPTGDSNIKHSIHW